MEILVITSSFIIRGRSFLNKPAVYYLGMYLLMLFVQTVFIFLFYRFGKDILGNQRKISVTSTLLMIFMLLWCAFISLIDQFSSGQIIVYIGAAISIAVVPYFKPVKMLAMYSSVHVLFLILLPQFHPAQKGLFGNSLNSTLFVAMAWIISCMRYKSLIVDFNKRKKIEEQAEELNRINQELKRMSFTDSLTGVYNRFMFDSKLSEDWEYCKNHSVPLALIIIDIDFFKKINDNYGHQEGDKYLKKISAILKESIKSSTNMIARYGGDEFAVIIPGMDFDTVSDFSENIRKDVEQSHIPNEFSAISEYVTISLGACSVIPSDSITVNSFIKSTDNALYEAKKNRNCCCAAVYEIVHT
jgi:diguanylate cyclase (GGDEF)-like protein